MYVVRGVSSGKKSTSKKGGSWSHRERTLVKHWRLQYNFLSFRHVSFYRVMRDFTGAFKGTKVDVFVFFVHPKERAFGYFYQRSWVHVTIVKLHMKNRHKKNIIRLVLYFFLWVVYFKYSDVIK